MPESGINWDEGYTEANCQYLSDNLDWEGECQEHFAGKQEQQQQPNGVGSGVVEWGGRSQYVDENPGVCTRAVANCSKNKYGTFREYTDRGCRCRDAENLCNWFLDTVTVPPPASEPEEPKQGVDDGKKGHWDGWLSYVRTGNSCAEAMADCAKYRNSQFAPYVNPGGRCRDARSACEEAAVTHSVVRDEEAEAVPPPPPRRCCQWHHHEP